MLCNNCKNEIDNAPFCPYCGTSQLHMPDTAQQSKGKPKTVPLVISAFLLSAAVIVAAYFAADYLMPAEERAQKLLDDYAQSVVDCDEDLFAELIPESTYDYYTDDWITDSVTEEIYDMYSIGHGYGDNLVIEFKVDSCDEFDDAEIDELAEDLEYEYDFVEDIEKAYYINHTFFISGDDDENEREATDIMFCVNNNWYLYFNLYI